MLNEAKIKELEARISELESLLDENGIIHREPGITYELDETDRKFRWAKDGETSLHQGCAACAFAAELSIMGCCSDVVCGHAGHWEEIKE
ncbi:hypothetical protein KAR91_83795 [Candidatus Pacearchaeota archaeon]|nr:hypothetical protein [Candidatus Pacearchaeota archaeon]